MDNSDPHFVLRPVTLDDMSGRSDPAFIDTGRARPLFMDERHWPSVGVVIVNWNGESDTVRCVGSVRASDYPSYELLVVDNGSRDASVATLCAALPDVPILRLPSNQGFTGGYNAGMRHLLGRGVDFVLLLNNDAVVAPEAIRSLVTAAQAHPDAALLGPLILALEQSDVIISAGGRLRPGCRSEQLGLGEVNRGQYAGLAETVEAVDFVSGCAILVRRTAVERMGLLDEDFFAYWEDVEWSQRAKRCGFETVLVPAARAWHPDTRDRDADSPAVVYYTTRNQLLFARKQRLGHRTTLRLVAQHFRTLASWSLRPRWRNNKLPQRDAMARAIWDFARGYVGEWPTATGSAST